MISQKYINEISYEIVGCAIEVHKILGAGLIESIYQTCMIGELHTKNLEVKSQVNIPLNYKGRNLNAFLKLDLLINDLTVVELKSVETMISLYNDQLSFLSKVNRNAERIINEF